jgi:hypothetical protein
MAIMPEDFGGRVRKSRRGSLALWTAILFAVAVLFGCGDTSGDGSGGAPPPECAARSVLDATVVVLVLGPSAPGDIPG